MVTQGTEEENSGIRGGSDLQVLGPWEGEYPSEEEHPGGVTGQEGTQPLLETGHPHRKVTETSLIFSFTPNPC